MADSRFQILRGVALLSALSTTKRPIKWLRDDEPLWIEPALAHALVQKGVLSYEGKYYPPTRLSPQGRIHFIREYEISQPLEDRHYWDDRPVTHWHNSQNAVPPVHIRDRVRADLWDQMLNRLQKPKSWIRASAV